MNRGGIVAIYKRCTRCGTRLPSGTKCDCSKQRHKEYDRYSRDKEADTFYHSTTWIATRDEVLRIDKSFDVYIYMTTGEIVIADTVHHITERKDDKSRELDIDNLISLHHDTHSKIHQMYKNDKEGTMKMLYEMLRRYRDGIQ